MVEFKQLNLQQPTKKGVVSAENAGKVRFIFTSEANCVSNPTAWIEGIRRSGNLYDWQRLTLYR